MAGIQEYLDLIKNAVYGRDVRQAIHDGIEQCYYDASGHHYQALDSKVKVLTKNKVNQPLDENNQPTDGESGQSLRTKGDGTTEWASVGLPTDEQTETAINAWLDNHPEATTTVQDGSLTTDKYKNKSITKDKLNLSLTEEIFDRKRKYKFGEFELETSIGKDSSYSILERKTRPLADFNLDSSFDTVQGCCYNSATGHVVFAVVNSSTFERGVLVETSLDLNTIYNVSNVLDIGHGNSLTYIPTKDTILCAVGSTGANAHKIVEIDASTYAITEIYTPYDNINAWDIAYDDVNEVVYYSNYSTLVICDTELNVLYTTTINAPDYVGQGAFVYNGTFYAILFDDTEGVTENHFCYYNLESGAVEKLYSYSATYTNTEPEDGFVVNGDIYILHGQNYVSLYRFSGNETESSHTLNDIYRTGESIPAGSDLNDYFEVGHYFSVNGANTNTLLNRPSDMGGTGFSLHVFPVASLHLMQIIVPNGERRMFYRETTGNFYTKQWTNWKAIIGTLSKGTNISNILAYTTGSLIGSGKRIYCEVPFGYNVLPNYVESLTATGNIQVFQNGHIIVGTSSGGVSLNDTSVIESYSFIQHKYKLFMDVRLVNAPTSAINFSPVSVLFQNVNLISNA